MKKTIIDLPDSEIKIKIAKCGKCNKIVYVTMEHLMNKASHREFIKCIKSGCKEETMNLVEYRKLGNLEWCNTKCDQNKTK